MSHHHCHEEKCHHCHCQGCQCDNCHCDVQGHASHCGGSSAGEYQGKYAEMLLEIADEAWMEVVKEKIKEEIRHVSGDHITALAKLVTNSNNARWKDRMQQKRDNAEFETKLHDMLSSPTSTKTRK